MTETALPYMVAWGRVQEIPQEVIDELLQVRDQAVLLLPDLVAQHAQPARAQAFYERYLRGSIRYTIEPADLEALDIYFRYAFYHAMIADIPAIKFLPDGAPADLPNPQR
jgi:hypothetical protein